MNKKKIRKIVDMIKIIMFFPLYAHLVRIILLRLVEEPMSAFDRAMAVVWSILGIMLGIVECILGD